MSCNRRVPNQLMSIIASAALVYQSGMIGGVPIAQAAANEQPMEVEWHVNKQEAEDLKGKFQAKEADAYETKNPLVVGLVILVGSFVVPQVIDAFGDLWEKYRSDGFVLDTRGDKLIVEKSARVPPGYIIVVSKEGVETVRVGGPNPDPKILQQILDRVIKK